MYPAVVLMASPVVSLTCTSPLRCTCSATGESHSCIVECYTLSNVMTGALRTQPLCSKYEQVRIEPTHFAMKYVLVRTEPRCFAMKYVQVRTVPKHFVVNYR